MNDFKMTRVQIFIILTAVLASLLEIIDTSIVNVAIPSMMGNLGATLEDISWVVTGYIIANAIVLPIAGWLGMQIGRKKYYVGCILLFTATSVACGMAPNLLTLSIFRVLQGLAGGALLPTSQALIAEQFPRERAGMGSAVFGMGVIIGPTIGPTLGGYLTDHFGWRMIFNINLPLGLLAAFLAYTMVGDVGDEIVMKPRKKDLQADSALVEEPPVQASKPVRVRTPIDAWGLMLLIVGIGCLQFVLERGQADDWFTSNAIRICTLLAAVAIPTFIWWELKIKYPIINLRLFKHPAVRNGTIMMMMLGLMLYSTVFVLPIFMNTIMGYTATQTGMIFIPGAILTAFMMPIAGQLMKKVDPRLLIFFGMLTVEVFLYCLTKFNPGTTDHQIFIALLARGFGLAFLFVPINAVVLGQFAGGELGQVAGLLNLLRQIGGSIGIASLSTLLQTYNAKNYSSLSSHLSLLNPATYSQMKAAQMMLAQKFQGAVGEATAQSAALKLIIYRVQKQIFCLSFTQMVWLLLICFGLAIIPLIFVKPPKNLNMNIDVH